MDKHLDLSKQGSEHAVTNSITGATSGKHLLLGNVDQVAASSNKWVETVDDFWDENVDPLFDMLGMGKVEEPYVHKFADTAVGFADKAVGAISGWKDEVKDELEDWKWI